MAIKNDYQAGTVSIAANGTVLTGVNTLWSTTTIQAGDTFKVKNLDAVIASVDSNTQITLAEPWTGGALTNSAYRIRFQPDGSRFTAALRDLVAFFSSATAVGLAMLTAATAADQRASILAPTYVDTRVQLKGLDRQKDKCAILLEGSRSGAFRWSEGDYSAQVALDTLGAIYIKANAVAASEGAWVRIYDSAINVRWFGAVGDNVTDDVAAFAAARDLLQTDSASRGGRIYAPKGIYKLSSTLSFTYYSTSGVHNIILEGDGPQSTALDFATAAPSTDGVAFGPGAHFGVRDISIRNAPRYGLALVGGAVGTSTYLSQGFVKNVRMQGSGQDGLYSTNTFLIDLEDCWATTNGRSGYRFAGFHTSISARRCWASGNVSSTGWYLNGVIYSSFIACAADNNMYNYGLQNLRGVVFSACGSEAALRDSWILQSGNAAATGLPSNAQNISSVVFEGCYSLHGGLSSPGTYSTFMTIITADSRPIDITLRGNSSIRSNVADKAIAVNGASGRIKIVESSPSYDGDVSVLGDVVWEGREFNFVPTVAGVTTAGTCTYGSRFGRYVIRDGICHFDIATDWVSHTGTGGTRVTGLPFASKYNNPAAVRLSFIPFSGQVVAQVEPNLSSLVLAQSPSAGGAAVYTTLSAAGNLAISGSYTIL